MYIQIYYILIHIDYSYIQKDIFYNLTYYMNIQYYFDILFINYNNKIPNIVRDFILFI